MSKSGRSLLDWLSLNRTELGLLLAIVLVFVLAGTIDPQHTYFDFSARRGAELSFKDILRQTSMLGIFALGSAVVIISGGIDLSCGSVIAFSGSVCATLMLLMALEAMTGGSELSLGVIAAAIVGTVLVGFLIGSLHAWLITVIGLPPFVATLATLVGLRSLGRSIIERVTNRMLDGTSTQIQIFDDRFRYLATSIWIPALIFAVLAVLFWLLLSRTVTGRHLYALGGNEQAAHLSGISTTRLKWLAYTLGAVTSSIAGILYIGDQAVADPQTLGRGYELNAIAAAVVGGCSLQGGVGTIPGTVLGVIFLRTVIDGIAKIIKTGADVYEGLIVGILVVVAVAFNQLRTAGSGRKRFFADALGIVAGVTLVILSALVCWLMAGDTPGVIGGTLALAAIVVLKLLEARARGEVSRMPAAEPIIAIRGVTKRFPGVTALDDVTFDVAAGELHAIVGENGAGKSTLMKILAGVITQYEGEILLRGQPYRVAGTRDAEAAGVSIIHQELNLVDDLSAAANIFLGRERRGALGLIDDRSMNHVAGELLGELECHVDPSAPVRHLRVGDQQLVEIAKALSLSADILIMDEPTSALTEAEVARLDRVIARLRQRGTTILYISHKMDEVFRLADHVTVLRDGKLIRTLERSETTPREITHLMVGREIEHTRLDTCRPIGDEVLRVERLSLPTASGDRYRLRDVSFSLRRGEIVGIAGLMGAGRTELLECLFGCSERAPQGTITVAGTPQRFTHPQQAIAAGLAMVSEDRKRLGLFAEMSVGENVTLCALAQATVGGLLSRPREAVLADGAIERLGVKTAGRDAAITSLSGGNQQKAILARWLLTEPRVLLLDDPTRGVDVGAKAELYRLMDRLCHEGLGIVVTSSELPELLTLCDRILVLCEGRLTGEFTRAEATEAAIMEAATATN